ncbi:MAG TPA: thymidine phosphorylase [Alphaproteobacteria bacterium]|nr:thymidine phosphorylase [Alphaproteobacteria bacterium]
MNFLSLIESKREGQALAPEDIQSLVREFTAGKIPDYQMAAMLMAIYFRGLNSTETRALTLAMRDSGRVLKFPKDSRPIVDKHSTGGIGDKVSLPLAPLLACLGFRIPMISGRGLGITGGTLDKLDSIPGFKTLLPVDHIIRQTQDVGCIICGQTDEMVPADKKIYALRDASGTVPSIPLIVASILSKKLAENLDALILDVKFGSAAFMQTKADARKLAAAMVPLGNDCGVNTRAILSDMNTPLGRAAGNWLEVKESVACLEGNGSSIARLRPGLRRQAKRAAAFEGVAPPEPGVLSDFKAVSQPPHSKTSRQFRQSSEGEIGPDISDLRDLVLNCAAHLLEQTRKAKDFKTAREMAADCLDSGAPRKKFDEMLQAQGADLAAFNEKLSMDSTAPVVVELKSTRAGMVSHCDARVIGEVIRDLGGGRLTKESAINYDVGIDSLLKPGERVKKGAVLARIHAATEADARAALARVKSAFEIS